MRPVLIFLLVSFVNSEAPGIQTETQETEFVPIGKDTQTITLPPEKPLPKSVGKVISTKVFTEDGIKYTEVVRKTPSGGTQVAHIKGDVKPSLLPVPMPNLAGLMQRLQTTLASRLEAPKVPSEVLSVSVVQTSASSDGPIIRRPVEVSRAVITPEDSPIINRQYYPSPPYPPMMMYSPYGPGYGPFYGSEYSGGGGLLNRVGSMTGGILDNVMDFVIGRRR